MVRRTVVIADDHEVYRQGLRALLERSFDVIGEAADGLQAIEQAISKSPDVVVLDIGMPGMDGLQAGLQIRKQVPQAKVVIISASDADEDIFAAIQAGVSAYLVKDDVADGMIKAVGLAADGKGYLSPSITLRVLRAMAEALSGSAATPGAREPKNALTPREAAVLRLLAEGLPNREIARTLRVSERTVGNQISRLYSKLGINDRAHAVLEAVRQGLVSL